MAEATTVSVLLRARDELSGKLKQVEGNMGKMAAGFEKHRRSIGMASTAIGAALTGIATVAVKSSIDQQIGIRQLDTALKQVGTSYLDQKGAIEQVIEAQQRKTNFGDEEQREVLVRLVGVLGDQEQALKALPAVLDAAAFSGKSAGTVSETLSKFLAGLANTSDATGVSVDKLATFEERLAEVMAVVSGQAEAAANPMTQLQNRVGDLAQSVGDILAPVLLELLPKIELMVRNMIAWTEAHPTLTKVLVIVAASLGAVMLVLGPMLLILPQLVMGLKLFAGGIRIVTAAMAANPVGALVAILTTLAMVALPLVIKHWDRIWFEIKKTTETVVNFVIGLINKMTLIYRTQLSKLLDLVKFVFDKIPNFVKKAIPGFEEFGASLDGVQQKLEDGIPTIDIVGDTFEATAKQTEKAAEQVGDAIAGQASAVEQSSEKIQVSAKETAKVVQQSSQDQINSIDLVAEATKTAQSKRFKATQELGKQVIAQADADRAAREQAMADLIESMDKTTVMWNTSGDEISDVMSGVAKHLNITVGQLGQQWLDAGTDVSNFKSVLTQAHEDLGTSWFNYSEKIQKELDKQENAYVSYSERMKNKARQLSQDIAQSAMEDFPETLLDVPIPKTPQQTAVEKTQSTLKEMRESPETSGAMRLAERTLKQHAMMSGVATTSEWATNTFDEKSMAHYKDIARQLSTQMSGTMKEAMEIYATNPPVKAQAKAMGGPAGGLTLVGERGPELVSLPNGSFVHPNGTGPRNQSNTFVFNGAVYGVEDLRQVVVEAVRDHAIAGGFSGVFAEA